MLHASRVMIYCASQTGRATVEGRNLIDFGKDLNTFLLRSSMDTDGLFLASLILAALTCSNLERMHFNRTNIGQ